jgi:hypothetical protein
MRLDGCPLPKELSDIRNTQQGDIKDLDKFTSNDRWTETVPPPVKVVVTSLGYILYNHI